MKDREESGKVHHHREERPEDLDWLEHVPGSSGLYVVRDQDELSRDSDSVAQEILERARRVQIE